MSDDRIDHKAEAEKHVAGYPNGAVPDQARDFIAVALVHATLAQVTATEALAEQQRIANLIALSALMLGKDVDQWLMAEIRKGLGLP